MMRDKEVSRDRKTLLILIAGGALAGGGYLAYRWWSKRPNSSSFTQKPPVTKDKEKGSTSRLFAPAPRETVDPSTEKFELRAPPAGKERVSIRMPPDVAADLSTSSTFEKVPSSSASPEPDSFVQLSISSYQDLPEVSVSASPGGLTSEASEKTAADELTTSQTDDSSIELLSESSMSFITVSSQPPPAEPVRSPQKSTGDDDRRTVHMEDKNDIVHVEKPSGDGAGEDCDRETSVVMGPGGDAPTGDGKTVEYEDDEQPVEEQDVAPPAVPASSPPETQRDNLVAEDDEEEDEDDAGGDETVEYNVSMPGNAVDDAEE